MVKIALPHKLELPAIKNSLELQRLAVSEGCLPDLDSQNVVAVRPETLAMAFDHHGNLLPYAGFGLGSAQRQA